MLIPPPRDGLSVLVFDMAHTGRQDGERIVPGFADIAAARAYAEARIRSSVEELRKAGQPAAELRSLWFLYGEDCSVIGDAGFKSSDMLDIYVAIPATAAECDWPALTPRPKRFHTTVLISDKDGDSVWAGGFLRRFTRPGRDDLLAIYADDARAAFTRKGRPEAEPASIHVANLFELPDPPRPPPSDGRPLRHWRIDVDFVCHDVKFGGSGQGVFGWPEQPAGAPLERMLHVLMADTLSMRGDGPAAADYSDVLAHSVAETAEPVHYPLD